MMHRFQLGLIVSGLILLVSCGQRPEDHSVADAKLQQAVYDHFAADHDTKGATARVEVHAKDGTVTLTGTVDTPSDRELAETLTQRTNGVVKVENQITVTEPAAAPGEFDEAAVRAQALASGESLGPSPEDVRIYDSVRRRLIAHEGTSKWEIFVDVTNGSVTLRGMVSTDEARNEAVAVAKETAGVKAVNDRLYDRLRLYVPSPGPK